MSRGGTTAATCSPGLRKSLCVQAIGLILKSVLASDRSGWLCSRAPLLHISQLFRRAGDDFLWPEAAVIELLGGESLDV